MTTTTVHTSEATATAPEIPTATATVPETSERGHENAFAITSFVLGIASIVSSWTFIAPIAGLVLGILALRRNTSERTLALWGVWMNAIMLAGTVLALTALVLIGGIGIIATLPFWG